MSELFHKLGIDWKLLLAQAVNFLVILTVLRLTVYKPLLKKLRERRERIEQGLKDAKDAGTRLGEVELIAKGKIANAERESLHILSKLEVHAREQEEAIMRVAKEKGEEVLRNAERAAQVKHDEAEKRVYAEAAALVRAAVAKTVELSPEAIDAALVEKAIQAVKKV